MDERGGGYEEPIPEPNPEPEQPPIYEEYDMADGKPFDESIMNNNLKGLLDSWKSDEMQQARQRQTLQDQINGLFLRQASDALTIANTLAQNNAVITMRINSNGVVLDNLALGGKLSSTDVTSAKLADGFKDTADKAIQAATAAAVTTSAPAQGTSGVAQGSLQTVGAVSADAIMAQITKLAEMNTSVLAALGVLTAKVAALEVNPA
jgi:hypothetical protein